MLTFVFMIALGLIQNPEQERPKIPKDSLELVLTGCLKGRLLAVSELRQPDTQSGPDVRAKSFRLAGKGDLMKEIKKQDGNLVEVGGLVKRSALSQPEVKIGKGIVISPGRPVAGSGRLPPPSDLIPVLDVQFVRLRSTSCS